MKTKTIMITLIPKFAAIDFGLKSQYVDSKSEFAHDNSTLKSSKSTPTNSKVESWVEYSKPKFVMVDSKLEFVSESEFPMALVESYLSIEFPLFDSFLLKSTKPKLFFSLVDPYIGFSMSATKKIWLIKIFN